MCGSNSYETDVSFDICFLVSKDQDVELYRSSCVYILDIYPIIQPTGREKLKFPKKEMDNALKI